MCSRGRLAVVFALICLMLPLSALGNTTQVLRYIGNQRGNPWGKQNLMVTVEPVSGGDRANLVVPNDPATGPYNPNKTVVTVLEKAQPGALFKIEMETIQGLLVIHSIAHYDLKPGEDSPHGYVFVEAKDETVGGETHISVAVDKLGQRLTLFVPNKKNKEGKSAPDWDMSHDVHGFKAGEVLDVETRPVAGGFLIVSLDKYVPPVKGEFVALTDVELEGVKHPAVSIKVADKTQTFLLPGEVVGKKWVANGRLLGLAKGLKPAQMVSYQSRKDGDQLLLRDIQAEKVEKVQPPATPPKKP